MSVSKCSKCRKYVGDDSVMKLKVGDSEDIVCNSCWNEYQDNEPWYGGFDDAYEYWRNDPSNYPAPIKK